MSRALAGVRDAASRYIPGVTGPDQPETRKPSRFDTKPEEWGVVSLKTISDFITKGSTPTTYGFRWQDSGILFLRSECVSPYGLDLGQSMRISAEAHQMLRRSEVRDGDILITITGNVGRVVLLRTVGVANINQHVARIRISAAHVNSEFVYHVLSQATVRQRFESITTGQAYPQISLRQVREAEIPSPQLAEQRAIAEALSDVDGLLGALEALIAKKRAIKQAALQQLLTGKTRLPGFSGEWETRRLGRHVTFLRHGTHSRAELAADGPVRNLHYGDIHASTEVFLNASETPMPRLAVHRAAGLDRLEDGDLVLVDTSEDLNGIGKSVEMTGTAGIEVVSGLHTITARFDKSVLADGFKGHLQFCPAFRQQLTRLAAGTKVYASNSSHIASVEISLPHHDEQVAIATVLSDMDAEIAALEARRDKTRAIKQGMMQQLLTGRVRLI